MRTFKKYCLILSLFVIILSGHSCENKYYDFRLKVFNDSNKTLYAMFYQSFPDTALGQHSPFVSTYDRIGPGETYTLRRGGTWEMAFEEDINEKLMIFIFDAYVIDNKPWETVRKNYMILKRYDLSFEDIVKLNWIVTYP